MAALRAAGLRCPDDVSIAGFDDHPMSRWWGLTTVSQHAHEQGVRAANAMIKARCREMGNGSDGAKPESDELQGRADGAWHDRPAPDDAA